MGLELEADRLIPSAEAPSLPVPTESDAIAHARLTTSSSPFLVLPRFSNHC
jgi:hypothetical protein